jgi:ATP-dependent RNA helicase DHX37/DHR1
MACFPVNPRYSKMLALASQQSTPNDQSILSYIICLISGLSVQELFIGGSTTTTTTTGSSSTTTTTTSETTTKIKYSQMRETWLQGHANAAHVHRLGDLMLVLVALGAVEYESSETRCVQFCEQYGIRYKAVVEARKLRKQLVNTINLLNNGSVSGGGGAGGSLVIDPHMQPPTDEQAKVIRQIVMSCMPDRLARLKEVEENVVGVKKAEKNGYEGLILEQTLFIHPSSVLFKEVIHIYL